MDKAWAWLPRNSLEYEAGAKNFVYGASSSMGNPAEILCPCVDCRNVCHRLIDTVVDHLVMRGMDLKYKRNPCWFNHGERRETVHNRPLGPNACKVWVDVSMIDNAKVWRPNSEVQFIVDAQGNCCLA